MGIEDVIGFEIESVYCGLVEARIKVERAKLNTGMEERNGQIKTRY